jgi:hypothetical protein
MTGIGPVADGLERPHSDRAARCSGRVGRILFSNGVKGGRLFVVDALRMPAFSPRSFGA